MQDKFTFHSEMEKYLHFDHKAYGEFVDYYNNYIEPQLVTDMAFCKIGVVNITAKRSVCAVSFTVSSVC